MVKPTDIGALFEFAYASRYTGGDVGKLRSMVAELREHDWEDEDGEMHMTPFPWPPVKSEMEK